MLLNDNEMGISHNYSSLARYLRRAAHRPRLSATPASTWKKSSRSYPAANSSSKRDIRCAPALSRWWCRACGSRSWATTIIGPVNGHSLPEMVSALKTARSLGGPVVLHTVTTKGKGFEKAEAKQIKWHAATPKDFRDVKVGEAVRRARAGPPTYTEVFSDTLLELAEKDERIVAITAAMPGGTGIDKFIERFPTRGFDVGMTEEHAVTFAAGLALSGLRPVVAIYSTFMQRAYDQIIHDVCQVRDGLPVTLALDRGGLVGEDGATHQGVFDLTYLRCIPHLVVMAPKDEGELRQMLATCLAHNGPAAVRYPRGTGVGAALDGPLEPLPIGKGELLRGAEGDGKTWNWASSPSARWCRSRLKRRTR